MTPSALARAIRRFRAHLPITAAFEIELAKRRLFDRKRNWYHSQKEHWLGWLSEYNGPGAYGRSRWKGRSAEFVYNHINCPPMALWLGEASGVSSRTVRTAMDNALSAGPNFSSQCAAIRRAIPWEAIAAAKLRYAHLLSHTRTQ
jgi:hypothetical protein